LSFFERTLNIAIEKLIITLQSYVYISYY